MGDEQDNEQLRFTTIHYGVLRQLKISANEYMILDMVYHLSAKHGYCYKSIRAIGADIGLTERGTRKIVDRLLERGLLNHSAAGLVCEKTYINAAYWNKVPAEQSSVPRRNKVPKKRNKVRKTEQSIDKNNNIDIQKNSNSTNVLVDLAKPKPTGKSYRHMFEELVAAVNSPQPSRVTPTDGRIRKLKVRLSKFSFEDILLAAKAIGDDPYLQGDNPGGKRWGDIDYLLRSDEQIDKWRSNADTASNTFDLSKEFIL